MIWSPLRLMAIGILAAAAAAPPTDREPPVSVFPPAVSALEAGDALAGTVSTSTPPVMDRNPDCCAPFGLNNRSVVGADDALPNHDILHGLTPVNALHSPLDGTRADSW